jgi:glutamate carboxypeptidase
MERRLIEKLQEFINIDSHAFKKGEIVKTHKFIKNYLKDAHFQWTEYPSTHPDLAPILFGKSKNWVAGRPEVTLTGHVDIVYPDTKNSKFKLTNDKIFGPGTADMKAGVLVILETVENLRKLNKLTNIKLLFTSEEEHFLTKYFPAYGKIARETKNLLVFEGEGSVDSKPDLNTKLLVTKRKGILAYNINAKGPGGHSGVIAKKAERHSTIEELIIQSQNLLRLADYKKGTTINIGKFNGGEALNILAPEAEIVIDARLDSISEHKRVLASIESIKSTDKEIKLSIENIVSGFPVEETPQNLKLFEMAKEAGKELGIKIGAVHKGGASDMNRMISFNPEMAALDYLGPCGGGEHTPNEFLYLETFNPCVKLSTRLIEKIQN